MIQIDFFKKQKHTYRHRKQIYGYQREKMGEGEINQELGLTDIHCYIQNRYQQGPIVEHRELYSISCNKL